jgi:hypothetical protein
VGVNHRGGLFVSYARVDRLRVEELTAVLRAGGFEPWWDDRLDPGDDWKAELKARITSCEAFLCLLSTDAIESEWCQWELAQAAALSIPIVPILLRGGTKIPRAIENLHYLDATDGLRNLDVAHLVGKLARLKQSRVYSPMSLDETPNGIPSRFKQPKPKEYRNIAQEHIRQSKSNRYLYNCKNITRF